MLSAKLQKRPKVQISTEPPEIDIGNGYLRLPDLVAPDGILEAQDYLQIGPDRYVKSFLISGMPSSLFVGWLDQLYEMGDVDVSIFVYPADERTVINKLTQKIIEMEAQLILDEQRGDTRYAAIQRKVYEDASRLREQIQLNQNKMFYVSILYTVAKDNLQELDRISRIIDERLGGQAIHTRQAFLRQSEAFKSVAPLCVNYLPDTYKNFDLGATTSLFPFASADIAHPKGVLLGINKITGAPVFYDAFIGPPVLQNRHIGIIATSGAGKSTLVKVMVARSAIQGIRTVFIDAEGEYSRLVDILGGTHVKLEPGGKVFINPFDVEPEEDNGIMRINLLEKVADLKGLIAIMVEGAGSKMTPEEAAIVEDTIVAEYRDRGVTEEPDSIYEQTDGTILQDGTLTFGRKRKEMPTFTSLWNRLSKNPRAENLCLLLKQYLRGNSLGIFDGQSQADLGSSPLVSFDVYTLEERFARPYAMHVCLEWVWEKFVKKNPTLKKRVVVDEAWLFMKYKDTAQFLADMARRSRKRLCSLVVATQNFTEFNSPEGKSITANLGTVILMMQAPHELQHIKEAFSLTDGETEFLRSAAVGDALIRAGSQVAVMSVAVADDEWQFIK